MVGHQTRDLEVRALSPSAGSNFSQIFPNICMWNNNYVLYENDIFNIFLICYLLFPFVDYCHYRLSYCFSQVNWSTCASTYVQRQCSISTTHTSSSQVQNRVETRGFTVKQKQIMQTTFPALTSFPHWLVTLSILIKHIYFLTNKLYLIIIANS